MSYLDRATGKFDDHIDEIIKHYSVMFDDGFYKQGQMNYVIYLALWWTYFCIPIQM